jgi:hypothetical protein
MSCPAKRRLALSLACAFIGLSSSVAMGAPRTWIGGNVDWIDAGSAANWNPADEPDVDDEAIFNTANTVNLGSNNSVNGLTMSGGIDLSTNNFALTVDGLVQLTGAGTNLFIRDTTGSVNADDVVINAGGTIDLRGGTLTLDEEVGTSLVDINAGGALFGTGTISFIDVPGVATNVLINDGTLTARSIGTLFSPPPAGTLHIMFAGGLARVDLDGTGEAGVVNINRNQTLDLDPAMSEAFNGTMNLAHNSTFDTLSGWTLGAGGSVNVNNGFIAGSLGFPDTPADVAVLRGGTLTMTGGTVNVNDSDGTLRLDCALTLSSGTIVNNGTVIFDGVSNINAAGGYVPSNLNSQTIVNADVTINDAANDFNWDGAGAADTTVNGAAQFSITADRVDTGDNVFGGSIILNDGGDLSVNVTASEWTLLGTMTKNGPAASTVLGDRIILTGTVTNNGGTLNLPPVTTNSANSIITNDLTTIGGTSVLAGGSITGTGTLRMEGTSTVSANTTIATSTFDWDGLGIGTTHTINDGVTFTINSPTLDTDGDMDDPINLGGASAQLIVNGPTQWTMNGIFNANTLQIGTATIGGTSRVIFNNTLNVDGVTGIGAPVTFAGGAAVFIDAGVSLLLGSTATFAGGVVVGSGTFSPADVNTVTADSNINNDIFDFDAGTWTVESGASLNVGVTDYDTTATNAFDSTITLNRGRIDVISNDATFVMDGTLDMNHGDAGFAIWGGEPLAIGNDVAALDANLNVTGNFDAQAQFNVPSVTFNSDADVNVAAGGTLTFLSGTTVNFNSVNGLNNAQFTGAGDLVFSGVVNVNEATTLDMVGGAVDLDGNDAIGDFVNVDAPLTINATTLASFGKVNGVGTNTLDINNSAGTGILTVNLDNPAIDWTLNGAGVMNLVNDNTEATLLSGNGLNVFGTVNVTGDVRVDARLDIAGTININTAGQPLRLSGGTTSPSNTNRLLGGTISGAGVLGADLDSALRGFGTINTAIDFDANGNLLAEDGTLTLNGVVIDVNTLGTGNDTGVLNIPVAWNSGTFNGAGTINAVELNGGTLQGGTITNDGGNGIAGFGTVTSRVINNQNLTGRSGTLVVQTAGNDNDWDGLIGNGRLRAAVGATLELRDNAFFDFDGLVDVLPGGRVFANGFALQFDVGSTLNLSSGTYEATSSTDIRGTVTVGAGAESRIKVTNNFFLTYEPTSVTTLNGNLRLENNNIIIDAGATFSGPGALIVTQPLGGLSIRPNGIVNVLLINEGGYRPAGINVVGRNDLRDFQQTATGKLFVELAGANLNQFDRIVVNGVAQLDGVLDLNLDGGYLPTYGVSHSILTALSRTGTFASVSGVAVAANRFLAVTYTANGVIVTAALPGDADLNGTVNFNDLLTLAQNYNDPSGAIWATGDFDGNGAVNFNDLLSLAQYYNQSILTGDLPGGAAFASDWATAQSLVPEPGILLTSLAGLTLLSRRRASCR